MLTLFAHAGEHHQTVVQETTHLLITEWYVALPLLFAVAALLALGTYKVTKSLAGAYLVATLVLLIAGVAAYTLVPIVSIVALSLGFALILLQVLTALRSSPQK